MTTTYIIIGLVFGLPLLAIGEACWGCWRAYRLLKQIEEERT